MAQSFNEWNIPIIYLPDQGKMIDSLTKCHSRVVQLPLHPHHSWYPSGCYDLTNKIPKGIRIGIPEQTTGEHTCCSCSNCRHTRLWRSTCCSCRQAVRLVSSYSMSCPSPLALCPYLLFVGVVAAYTSGLAIVIIDAGITSPLALP